MKVVIGIDPGLTNCGYALISQNGNSAKALSIGAIHTSKDDSTPTRLAQLHDELSDLINEYSPNIMALEKIFIKMNQKTGTGVTQAAGIAMALGVKANCEISEYTPKQIKKNHYQLWGS